MESWNRYIDVLKSIPVEDVTEHTHRAALQNLLESIDSKKMFQHEPKRETGFGAPDYKVMLKGTIIGYVENKKIEEDLDKILKSDQIKKYKQLSGNILLTNYIEWIWLKDGEVLDRKNLCYKSDLEYHKFKVDKSRAKDVELLIVNFLSQPPREVGNAKKLAEALAVRAKLLKEFLHDELKHQHEENREGTLYQLYETFREYVFNELDLDEFADAFAQNLVYGLFLAKLNADVQEVTLYNAKKFIPGSFELIRELVNFLDELDNKEYRETKWIVEEVLTILNYMNLREIQRTLHYTSNTRKDLWDESDFSYRDPFIYFYELFLSVYDKKLRKARGVYYTPPQVVNFIVRAVNDILKSTFEIEEGLADRKKVTVLDFATGTGTFLLETLQQIFDELPANSAKKDSIVREHILKNIFGFEYLIAPYTIAHLKLSQFLKDNGYTMSDSERLQVYLTNTLEPGVLQTKIAFLPALSKEIQHAKKVKEQPILVITGNPPYSGHSKNPSERKVELKKGDIYNKGYKWSNALSKVVPVTAKASKEGKYKVKTEIGEKLMDYFFVDGAGLGEKNPKWLQDDYVKFFRFAQDKMDKVDEGIVAIITNHRFLTNPTFRGMRQSLMKTFDQMYFIDLHGSNKPKETTPDGGTDTNVFDIEQGVAISILVKRKGLKKAIYHSDFWGKREEKYKLCINSDLKNVEWGEVKPSKPEYLFKPQVAKLKEAYNKFYPVKDVFKVYSNGIVTKRDGLVISDSLDELLKKIKHFANPKYTDIQISEHFKLPIRDKDKWDLKEAREHIGTIGVDEANVSEVNYRPFDKRYIFYDEVLVARLVKKVMDSFNKENQGLILGRAGQNVTGDDWDLAFCCNSSVDLNIFSRGGGTVFPIYTYKEEEKKPKDKQLIEEPEVPYKSENFTVEFREYVNDLYGNPTPEEILGYIYAVLHSPAYRKKYAEFLKIDFPRVPFTEDKKLFKAISKLGNELIEAHLQQKKKFTGSKVNYTGKAGTGIVEDISYNTEAQKLFINKTQAFEPVAPAVWNFHIGGYPVLGKYLKDRKGRALQSDEIDNVEAVVRILEFTLEQMEKIDAETKTWI